MWLYFNPRLQQRRRRAVCVKHRTVPGRFQSTPPTKEATPGTITRIATPTFQSTPPTKEATRLRGDTFLKQWHFNPRLQQRRRPFILLSVYSSPSFQSTPPTKEATADVISYFIVIVISIHASNNGGEAMMLVSASPFKGISIHASNKGGDQGQQQLK